MKSSWMKCSVLLPEEVWHQPMIVRTINAMFIQEIVESKMNVRLIVVIVEQIFVSYIEIRCYPLNRENQIR